MIDQNFVSCFFNFASIDFHGALVFYHVNSAGLDSISESAPSVASESELTSTPTESASESEFNCTLAEPDAESGTIRLDLAYFENVASFRTHKYHQPYVQREQKYISFRFI